MIFFEMNEINFDFVNFYIKNGHLPNLKNFIDSHGLFSTKSETKYSEIEPWIQWPSIRTGLDYSEHKIFRLGDVENKNLSQHWEILEEKGFSVAAMSPINAINNTKNSPFWIPDPWINTNVTGDNFLQKISLALKQSVNDNAKNKLEIKTIIALIDALLTKSQFSSYFIYLKEVISVLRGNHWSKAIILDRILADIFIKYWKKHKPDFATLFLNAGAHIQHHYMCNSKAYKGDVQNPNWYIKKNVDPLIHIYKLYDRIIGELYKNHNVRLLIAVGSQQVPYEKPKFYWRLKDHKKFINKLGIKYKNIKPRMTRDFLIEYDSNEDLQNSLPILENLVSSNGEKIFGDIEVKEKNIFLSLIYQKDIGNDFSLLSNQKKIGSFRDDVVFVAIKNGHHHGNGYYLDSYKSPNKNENTIHCKDLFNIVMQHFDVII